MAAPLFPDVERCEFCHRAGCGESLGEDLPSPRGQDANKMTGKSLGPWLSRAVWDIINHTGYLNAAGFNAEGKNEVIRGVKGISNFHPSDEGQTVSLPTKVR